MIHTIDRPAREDWLLAFARHPITREVFADAGAPIPRNLRVSVGFTGGGSRARAIGQCWDKTASADGCYEIFIIPGLADPARVADVLTHEIVHAAVGLEAGHGAAFRRVAVAVGLEGRMTATRAGERWREWALPVLDQLGPFPHAALNTSCTSSAGPRQKNRQIKAACNKCGFIIRASRTSLYSAVSLRCPDAACRGSLEIHDPEDE